MEVQKPSAHRMDGMVGGYVLDGSEPRVVACLGRLDVWEIFVYEVDCGVGRIASGLRVGDGQRRREVIVGARGLL